VNKKELIAKEIEQVPEPFLEEVLDFVRFLKSKRAQELEPTLLSESASEKIGLGPRKIGEICEGRRGSCPFRFQI
jgi:hypothetical protein